MRDTKIKTIFNMKLAGILMQHGFVLLDMRPNENQNGKQEWVYCPVCGNKTRLRLREDTVLTHFPLFCPKCKKESLIDAKEYVVKEIK